MKKLIAVLIAGLLLLMAVVAAQTTCNDLDNGPTDTTEPEPFIGTAAKVEYGITDKTDECISGKEGYHKDPSLWVREYYCGTGQAGPQRMYQDYDCTRYGYTGCEGGKCIGKSEAAAKKQAQATAYCGDKKVQAGEQCDPPDSICHISDEIGICTRPNDAGLGGCQCKLYQPGKEGTAEPETKENKTEELPEKTEAPEKLQEQKPAEKRQPLPEEFEEGKGVGFTRSITNSIKRFFRWIWGWFS